MKKISLIAITIYCASITAQVNLTSSLTACYAFNGNATEAINASNGTLTGVSAVADRNSNPGFALDFAGHPASYVELPNDPGLKPAKSISISGWYKPTSVTQNMTMVFTKNIYGSYHTAYGVAIENFGSFRFTGVRQSGFSSDFVIGTTIPVANTWYHVVMCMDTAVMKIYVNGVLEGSIANTITNFNYDWSRGVIVGGTNEIVHNPSYNGSVDNLRFYSRIITQAEVSALYNQDPSCLATGAPPVAQFTVSSLNVCAGGTVSLVDQSSNSPTAWNWNVPGGVSGNSTLSTVNYTFNTPGIYTASLTSSNGSGMSTNTATQSIVVHAKPAVFASSTRTVYCKNEPVKLTGNGATTYTWNNSSTTGPTITISSGATLGLITYTIKGTDANGCSNSNTFQIMVVTDCATGVMVNNQPDFNAEIYPNPNKGSFNVTSTTAIRNIRLTHVTGKLCLEQQSVNAMHSSVEMGQLPVGIYILTVESDAGMRNFRIVRE